MFRNSACVTMLKSYFSFPVTLRDNEMLFDYNNDNIEDMKPYTCIPTRKLFVFPHLHFRNACRNSRHFFFANNNRQKIVKTDVFIYNLLRKSTI